MTNGNITGTPQLLRTPVAPMLQTQQKPIYVDYNQSLSLPASRQTHYATPLPKKHHSTNLDAFNPPVYLDVYREMQMNYARTKLKFSIFSLTLVCFVASFFTYLSLHRLETLENLSPNISYTWGFGNNTEAAISAIIWEISFSITLVTLLSSLCAFFVAGVQLFFVFKIIKSQPNSLKNALDYLTDGKFIRMASFFIWYLSVIAFIFCLVMATLMVPSPLCSIAKGIAAAFGLTCLVFCGFASLQSIFSLCKMDQDSAGDIHAEEEAENYSYSDHHRYIGQYLNMSTLV